MDSEKKDKELSIQIGKLEDRLADLAAQWRGMPMDRQRIKEEYHATMRTLLSLGWDDYLDFDSILPDEHMPPEYMKNRLPERWGLLSSWTKKRTQK